jgi:hypothetical protein
MFALALFGILSARHARVVVPPVARRTGSEHQRCGRRGKHVKIFNSEMHGVN